MESELLAAIRAAPDEDGPRLVYADWLLERGHAPRAELIRIQCERAHPDTPPERREALTRRQQVLFELYGPSWMEALGLEVGQGYFVRGFIEELTLRGDQLPLVSERALQQPLRTLNVRLPFQREALLGLGWLERLERLCIESPDLTPATLATLSASPRLGNLRALALPRCWIGDGGAAALAGSEPLRSLQSLELPLNGIGPSGALALAQAPHLRPTHLHLSHNPIGPVGLPALLSGPLLQTAHTLSLASNNLGDEGTILLANSEPLRSLRTLDLQDNNISQRGAQALLASLPLRNLERLDLRGNPIRKRTAHRLYRHFGAALVI